MSYEFPCLRTQMLVSRGPMTLKSYRQECDEVILFEGAILVLCSREYMQSLFGILNYADRVIGAERVTLNDRQIIENFTYEPMPEWLKLPVEVL